MSRSNKVDIGGLLAGSRQLLLLDDEVSLEPFEGIRFPTPARVHLELHCVDQLLHIEGSVDVSAQGDCDACLEGVDREVHVDVDERFDPTVRRDDDPFGEANVLTGDRLDVADLAQQLVLSILPLGLRCSDDCKGLCADCGANKNAGACSCDNGDSRGKSKMENPAQ
jgi:uncharacterized protein